MIEHGIKKFVVRQKGFKDIPVTFVGDKNGWWIGVIEIRNPIPFINHSSRLFCKEPGRNEAYGCWANIANLARLSNQSNKPYVMKVK